ncbi:hypothetical protein [Actinoplanes sp. GCM10030250]|uniref:hypothetical protein n=1 Tax=Actinoplanes sp. GCM10030250 TaxID=3273376 RepID=UPI003609F66E
MWVERRARQAWHAAVLTLVLGAAWIAVLGVGRGEWSSAGESRPAAVTAVPPSFTPVLPEARPIGKPLRSALLLLIAVVAVLFGARRRVTWPAAAGTASTATTSTLLHAIRGRAPPRLPA